MTEPIRLRINLTSLSVGKPRKYWFYIRGFNFGIISGLFVVVFGKLFGRWKSLPLALLGIAGYAVLAGASGGVVRADIMGGLGVFATQIGRGQVGLNSLAFAAAMIALADLHVLQSLERCTLLRTARNSWIEVAMDGEQMMGGGRTGEMKQVIAHNSRVELTQIHW